MTLDNKPMPRAPAVRSLPFFVRPARTADDLAAACRIRSECYSRHDYDPALWKRFLEPETYDSQATVLMAIDKDSGECVGTLRVNFSGTGPMPLSDNENVSEVGGAEFAYIDRFAVTQRRGHVEVRLALMKAMWLHVCDRKVPWVVASAMAPLVRLYNGVGLRPLRGAEEGFPNPKLHPTELYYVVGGHTDELLGNILRNNASMATFFVDVHHPDIGFPWPPAYMAQPEEDESGLWPLLVSVADALLPDFTKGSTEDVTVSSGSLVPA